VTGGYRDALSSAVIRVSGNKPGDAIVTEQVTLDGRSNEDDPASCQRFAFGPERSDPSFVDFAAVAGLNRAAFTFNVDDIVAIKGATVPLPLGALAALGAEAGRQRAKAT
jgi:hypothetical protein